MNSVSCLLVSCLPASERSVSLVHHPNILSETLFHHDACDSISGHSLFPITGVLTFCCQQSQGVKWLLSQARAALLLPLKPPLGCLHSCIASFLVVSVHKSLKLHRLTKEKIHTMYPGCWSITNHLSSLLDYQLLSMWSLASLGDDTDRLI